jgi:hypothetical protein
MGDRKARLAALAARAGRSKSAEESSNEAAEGGDIPDDDNHVHGDEQEEPEHRIKPPIVFRNYTPKDTSLLHHRPIGASNDEDDDDDNEDDDENHNDTSSPSLTPPLPPSSSTSSPSNKRPRPGGSQPLNGSTTTSLTTTPKPMTLSESLARAKQEIAHQIKGGRVDPSSAATVAALAPEKINGDLKRGIQHKLAKLERRTQKAIVAMLKERLEQEAAAATQAEEGEDDHDENDLD